MPAIEPEVTVRGETVFAGTLIDVRRETVRLPGGKSTAGEIVVHPDVGAVLPLLHDGRLVFVRRYRKAAERILLEAPAGGIDEGARARGPVPPRPPLSPPPRLRLGPARRLLCHHR